MKNLRILYGIQTTGNGHISRSSLLVKNLKELGHKVDVLFSGATEFSFWDMDVFVPFNRYKGLTFVSRNGRIDNFATAMQLDIARVLRDVRQFENPGYDLVVTDFEPLSARIARRFNIPSVGVSHQCAFRYRIPSAKFNYMGRYVTRVFAPTDINLGLHWHHFGQPILPPIIDTSMKVSDCTVDSGKILVYLPFEKRETVRTVLGSLKSHRFHIYEKRDEISVEHNLVWNPFSRQRFKSDLLECDGVICQSGFELPSEAIHLGKKLLVKPVYGQFEQLSNALVIDRYGMGSTMSELQRPVVKTWLDQNHPHPANYPNVAREIAGWISLGKWDSPQDLADALWSRDQQNRNKLEEAYAA